MPWIRPKRETTGLRRGDAAKIARVHRCADSHVRQVALGERPGRAALIETIERYRDKAVATASRTGAQ